MESKWNGGQSGIIPIPKNENEKNNESSDNNNSYQFVQLCDTQLGMMSYMRQNQWKRPFVRLITCGSLILPPLLESAPEASIDPLTYALNDEALDILEQEICKHAVNHINSMSPTPAFVVVCGDLVNAFPTRESQNPANTTDLHNLQKERFKSIFSNLRDDIPLVCLCGNHDVGERPTPLTIEAWRQSFGKDYFKFSVGPDLFIVINSQLYKDGTGAPQIAQEQDEWLNETLMNAKGQARYIMIFSHIPPFIDHPDEPSGYFPLATPIRKSLLSRIAEAGGSHWFAGHYHRNAGGFYKHKISSSSSSQEPEFKLLEVITTAAVGGNINTNPNGDSLGLSGMESILLSESLSGMRIVNVSNEGIKHHFQTFEKCLPCSTTSQVKEYPTPDLKKDN